MFFFNLLISSSSVFLSIHIILSFHEQSNILRFQAAVRLWMRNVAEEEERKMPGIIAKKVLLK